MFHRSLGWDGPRMDGRTVGSYCKKTAKNEIQKFVKLTDRTDACNDLTNFEGEAQAMTGNGNYVNMLKLACKNLLNKIK